ncbi:MAG: LytTR family DNA-binding domain-containing protein [Chitinophagaceae bacterium]
MSRTTDLMPALNRKYKCIIADDDEVDRLTTVSFVRQHPFLQIDGVFETGTDALEWARSHQPDVLFLDIDMPGLSGVELRKQLESVPACIFITSHPEYAIDAFDIAALDFIVKPIRAVRFEKAMDRLHQFLEVHFKAGLLDHTLGEETIFIKSGHDQIKIKLHDVIYLEALKDYTRIVTRENKYCVLSPLGTLITHQGFRNFVRIHRSYAVQKHFVEKIASGEVTINEVQLPIGRSYREAINSLLIK